MNKRDQATYENQGGHLRLSFKFAQGHHEKSRVYTFPGGDTIEILDIVEARISRHGGHQLLTKHGIKHVVPWRWICLTIDGPDAIPEKYKLPVTDRKPIG